MKIGDKLGKLTLIREAKARYYGKDAQWKRYALFECECGNTKEISVANVVTGNSRSCGCSHLKHMKYKHPLYKVWDCMKQRCYYENAINYHLYGGRGILICDEWRYDFGCFYDWSINNGYKKDLVIDRVNNDGNYEPSNCQFITQKENNAIGKKRMPRTNTSGYVGVNYHIRQKKYQASIRNNEKTIHLGTFEDINKAVEARINKEIELFGEQKTNFHYKTLLKRADDETRDNG
jgi:hypothetical protein